MSHKLRFVRRKTFRPALDARNGTMGMRSSASLRPGLFVLCLMLAALYPLAAAEWQWSVPVKSEKPERGPARAWLWIPPACERVHGVVVAQHNMEEISILEHPKFRAALAEMNFAEVWVAPFFDHLFRFNEGAGLRPAGVSTNGVPATPPEDRGEAGGRQASAPHAGDVFNDLMNRLAEESGFAELKFAPVVPIGHSAAASWPYYFAAWAPERTLCALSVSGQWPYFRHKDWAPDIWGDRTIDFVPSLETMGEYEAAATWSREGLKERQEHPKMPLSMLACPGEGHFAGSDAKAEFLAFYLKKAVQYRVPKDWKADAPPKLIPVDPTQSGWLAEKWRQDQAPATSPAPLKKYQGDPKEAFWFFDEETVRAVERYQAQHRGKKPQLVGFLQDGQFVEQRSTHQQVNLRFQPQADGVTFKVAADFYDAVPDGSGRLTNWTGLPVGAPLAHAADGGPIVIERICGPFAKLGADTFALHFDRTGLGDGKRPLELWFAAQHPGDAEFKPAVQQAQMIVPARNTEGTEQRLTFPEIPDQTRSAGTVKLNAASDAGVPVHYYVREGPAEVEGDTLRLTAVPPRAKFPVRVTVVAWQYGRSAEPRLKTAEPVEQTFLITR